MLNGTALLLASLLGGCRSAQPGPDQRGGTSVDAAAIESFPHPPPREPGPPRPESAPQIAAASAEAAQLIGELVKGGISGREAASVADMRGYRLYRQRYFGRARAWFRAAIQADPTLELSLYNGARCAALLGDVDDARALLSRLRRLGTPLSRARLRSSLTDPDLAALRQSRDRGG